MGGGVGFDFTKCATSNITGVKRIQIAPVEPSPTRAPPAAEVAQLNEVMARNIITMPLFGFFKLVGLTQEAPKK